MPSLIEKRGTTSTDLAAAHVAQPSRAVVSPNANRQALETSAKRDGAKFFEAGKASSQTLIDQFLAEQSKLTAVEKFSQRHEQQALPAQEKYYRDLIPLGKPKGGEQYAFVVELDKCSGCKACVCACHSLNGLDEGELWRSVGLLVGGGETESIAASPRHRFTESPAEPYQQHVTTACHHCVEPGCADGCPVLAYEKDPLTGIVRHLDDQCIGCQYCVLKCPYEVPKYSPTKGIVRKCDMCHSRLAVGEAPACVQACPHEAIRIEIVDQVATRTAASEPAAALVPGAFSSSYTLPTTRFETRNPLPLDARPADDRVLRLEDAHWPLVFMLILTQLAAGMHLVLSILSRAGLVNRLSVLNFTAAGILFLGLNVSVTHLGRPLKAWRAFLGWRKSWMSREIMGFAIYAGLAALLVFKPGNVLLSVLTAIAALVGVFCSAMIYVDTRRPAWARGIVFIRFFGTTLLLGTTGGAVWAGWCEPKFAPALALATTLIRTFLFGWEWNGLLRARRNFHSPTHRSALIAFQFLGSVLRARIGLFAASTTFSLLAIFNLAQHGAIWGSVACATTVTSQVLERYTFFATSNAPRMPGGVA